MTLALLRSFRERQAEAGELWVGGVRWVGAWGDRRDYEEASSVHVGKNFARLFFHSGAAMSLAEKFFPYFLLLSSSLSLCIAFFLSFFLSVLDTDTMSDVNNL